MHIDMVLTGNVSLPCPLGHWNCPCMMVVPLSSKSLVCVCVCVSIVHMCCSHVHPCNYPMQTTCWLPDALAVGQGHLLPRICWCTVGPFLVLIGTRGHLTMKCATHLQLQHSVTQSASKSQQAYRLWSAMVCLLTCMLAHHNCFVQLVSRL